MADANKAMAGQLAALKAAGVERVTARQFTDTARITGRSRPWVYRWLDDRVKDGHLIKDSSQDRVGYTFAY